MILPKLWSPFERLSLVDNRIDDLLNDFSRFHPALMWRPAIDVAENDKRITVRAEIPGFNPKDIHLTIEDHHMILKGEKESEKKKTGKKDHWAESFHGSFSRTFHLPETIETKRIKAKFKNGILEITLPKRTEAKPKKVAVEMN